ncbi:hypothetical protein COY07_00980 [Candidatus Peregrinibacteria bacterium CG_4_10_14_0_2_um_filter_43_11]|nr:MAG: hypothetical protein COY07_00980 [Candidatus Peregrinibacteria bacterium CG_4_10_14_0_2_um_filter_43_11]
MLHILILNLSYKNDTIQCIQSVLCSSFVDFKIHVLDNGSVPSELSDIKGTFIKDNRLFYYRSEINLGFAGGNNWLLRKILPQCDEKDFVLFLNNDTVVDANLLERLVKAIDTDKKIEMVTGRMMGYPQNGCVDNLGLGLYMTGWGFNRTSLGQDVLFGAHGGCGLYTVHSLKTIQHQTGYIFDPDYFCYAEDIDLAWRALLLGFKPIYVDDAVCFHKGGATTGGHFNDFVMFHSIRNALFNLIKNMPSGLWLRYGFWIIVFQLSLMGRYIFTKRIIILLRAYGSFLKHFLEALKKRRQIMKTRQIDNEVLSKYFTKRFYKKKTLNKCE